MRSQNSRACPQRKPAGFQFLGRRGQQKCVPLLPWVRKRLTALKPKDFEEHPISLGGHLKKRRKQLGLLQREAAKLLGCDHFTYINWENDKTEPVASRFKPVIGFLGYDPSPTPVTLAERVQARRRELGLTFAEVAHRLGWDEGTLTRYLNETWRLPLARAAVLTEFLEPSDRAN